MIESVEPIIVFICAHHCKELVAPIAQAVMATKGIRLALMDADKCPAITQQLKVEVLPTCLSFMGGKAIDRTAGEMAPEACVAYVKKVVGLAVSRQASQLMIDAGKMMSEGKMEAALQAYMAVVQMSREAHGAAATAGMALCALNLKDTDAARDLVETIKRDFPKDLEDPIVKQAMNAVRPLGPVVVGLFVDCKVVC